MNVDLYKLSTKSKFQSRPTGSKAFIKVRDNF